MRLWSVALKAHSHGFYVKLTESVVNTVLESSTKFNSAIRIRCHVENVGGLLRKTCSYAAAPKEGQATTNNT